jgi:3-oxoacyl-[acyl-carrier protein] reductase
VLAARGLAVVISYSRDISGAAETVRAIENFDGQAIAVKADARKPDETVALFDAVKSRYGHLDVLVNNAGIAGSSPLSEIEWNWLSEVIDVNLKAAIFSSSRALPLFPPKGGAIINISSSLATQPLAGQVAYAASKGGIESMTRVLAAELGARNIRVNAIAPGPVATALLPADQGMRSFIVSRTPLARIGKAEDIANVAAFLASDEACWITGQIVSADGGFRS